MSLPVEDSSHIVIAIPDIFTDMDYFSLGQDMLEEDFSLPAYLTDM